MSDYNGLRKRPRYNVNSTNAGPLQRQRNSTWGIYNTASAYIAPEYPQQNAIINLPPSESVLFLELGGNENIQSMKAGETSVALSAGLGGCQRIIADGVYDSNGYYNFTEENCFVQLLAYRFKINPSDNTKQYVECCSCYIDMTALKLALSASDGAGNDDVVLKRLQEELCFALVGQQCISWPRFCMWNSSIAPGGCNRSSNCKPWMPQGNPVDNSFNNQGFSMFQQTIPPLLLVQLTGLRQLTFSLNPAYTTYCQDTFGISYPWFFQLMTPRTQGVLDQGDIPMSLYVNSTLIDGNHGWFERGPYCFGFGYLNYNTSEYVDVYKLNNWTTSQFANTIGGDFTSNPTRQINYDATNPWYDINIFCASRFLLPVVVANMPCSLSASRFYFVTSREASLNQVKSFVSSSSQPAPYDTIAMLWDNPLHGNVMRDTTGNIGEDEGLCSNFIKEMNPMFNQDRMSLHIIDEWASSSLVGGSSQANRHVQCEYSDVCSLKDNAVYNALYKALAMNPTPPTNQNGVAINPITSGFPFAIYSPYVPRWMSTTTFDTTTGFNVQFDVRRYCRNRCLVSFSYLNSSTPYTWLSLPGDIATYKPYGNVVSQLWNSSKIEDGELKSGNESIYFMRLIGF